MQLFDAKLCRAMSPHAQTSKNMLLRSIGSRALLRSFAPRRSVGLLFALARTFAVLAQPGAASSHRLLTPLHGWAPQFDKLTADDVQSGIQALLPLLHTRLDVLEKQLDSMDASLTVDEQWQNVVVAVEKLGEELDHAWSTIAHLQGVRDEPALRDAVAAIQSDVIAFQLRLSQSKPIYDALVRLRQNLSANDTIRARVLDVAIRDAKHDGVGLSGGSKVRFNQLAQQMSNIARQFSHNVLDATKALTYVLRDKADIANLPASLIAQGANAAKAAGLCAEANPIDGPWQFTLDPATYQSLMTYSASREWRQRYYEDMQKRAAPAESDLVTKSFAEHQCRADASATPADAKITDNGILLHQMLAARSELASLLGYTDYAHVSCASKMTEKPSVAFDMLNRLQQVAAPAARAEFSELEEFARAHGGPHELKSWDVPFWAERQRQALYDFSAEELRAYFPLPRVLEGLFELLSRLFGVRIVAADGLAPVWADGVSLFAVYNADGTDPIAYLFVDPYARPANKRGGAWMSSCSQRTIDRLPVAHIVCNQAPPMPPSKEHPSGRPSLMTFREVETLFHEFGHALQHILTTQIGSCAGIRGVEWDAVELPSQFMENFLYDRDVSRLVSAHVDTGASLPDEMLTKLHKAKNHHAALQLLRQLHFALTDLRLHSSSEFARFPNAFALERDQATLTTVKPALSDARFLCAFSHIFAGGYASGYYSYKWAEVLSADAYGAFDEFSTSDQKWQQWRGVGRRFRDTVLSLGGAVAPAEVFQRFRGRAPSPDALLESCGLKQARAASAAAKTEL